MGATGQKVLQIFLQTERQNIENRTIFELYILMSLPGVPIFCAVGTLLGLRYLLVPLMPIKGLKEYK